MNDSSIGLDFSAMPWDFAVLLAVLAVLVPWRGRERLQKLLRQPELTSADRLTIYFSTIAVQWIGAALVWWRGNARGFSGADWGLAVPDGAAAVSATAVMLAVICGVQLVSLRRMAKLPAERQGTIAQILVKLMPRGMAESAAFVALAATAGVCEEFVYRGFALTVMERVAGGSAGFGILASSALFGVAHLYQGRRGMAATFVAGLLFAVSRELTGSLVPAMAAHAAVDAIAGLLAGRVLKPAGPIQPEDNRTVQT